MKADKLIKVIFRQVPASQEEVQQRLDEVFDLFFEEILRLSDKNVLIN